MNEGWAEPGCERTNSDFGQTDGSDSFADAGQRRRLAEAWAYSRTVKHNSSGGSCDGGESDAEQQRPGDHDWNTVFVGTRVPARTLFDYLEEGHE